MPNVIKGAPALSWGWLETTNLIKTILPIIGTSLIAYLTTLTTDTSTPTAVAIGAVASVLISVLNQYLSNNTNKQVTRL